MDKYKLKNEHKKMFPMWRDKWIKNAFSTEQLKKEEIPLVKKYVSELYKSANLIPPPDHRIVIVSSPFIARFASGFAAWIWYCRKNKKEISATRAAIDAATSSATRAAINVATNAATNAATDDAIRDDYKEWYFINGGINGIINVAKKFGNIHSLFACSNKVYRIYQGGNCWSGWLSFITFFRYIVKLNIDYSKWNAYEKLGEMTGFRFMHEKFCIVSEKPIKLTIDDQNRPHCDDGPYCEWKDGSKLYCINGVRVPMWLVEKPRLLTIDKIQKQENVEVQRIMIERYGVSKYLVDIDAKLLDMDSLTLEGSAPRCLMEDKFGNRYLVGTDGSTKRVYHMRVENVETCVDAHNQLCGFNEKCLIAEA